MNQPVFPLGPLQKAVFVQRDNRFRAEVELDGQRAARLKQFSKQVFR